MVEICLVSDDDKREVDGLSRSSLDENLVVPTVEFLERRRVGDVVDKHATVGATEVTAAQAAEALLTRRVPDLQGGPKSICHCRQETPSGVISAKFKATVPTHLGTILRPQEILLHSCLKSF